MKRVTEYSSRAFEILQSAIKSFAKRIANLSGACKESINTLPVRVVITGIEHSGTTLLSSLIKQNSLLAGGFECGFLLADRPHDFKNVLPWYEWMQEPVTVHQWGVSAEHMERICSANSWEQAYRRLLKYSPVFDRDGTQQIFDKTARYMICLDDVLDKLPDYIPCIVIEKDVEDLWRSHKKRNATLEDFCLHFERYYNGLRRAVKKHGEKIHRVNYEVLCNNLPEQLKDIFSIIDLEFKDEYVSSRHSNIQEYNRVRNSQMIPLAGEEVDQLSRLKNQFADILIP